MSCRPHIPLRRRNRVVGAAPSRIGLMEIRVLRAGDDRLVAAAFHHNLAGRVTDEGAGGVPETDQLVEVWTFSP